MRREKLSQKQSFIFFRTAHVGDRADFGLDNFVCFGDCFFVNFFAAQKFGSFSQIQRNRRDSAGGNVRFDYLIKPPADADGSA